MPEVLLLDKNYVALNIIGWKKTLKLLVNGKAEPVHNGQKPKIIPYAKGNFIIPSVVRLLTSVPWRAHPASVKFTRKNVIIRDNMTCFTPNMLVLMSNGSFVPIKEIKIGDKIIDGFGKEQIVEFVNKEYVNKIIYEIRKIGNGDSIFATPDHPFLIYENNNYIWKSARELTTNDYLCEPKIFIPKNKIINQIDLFDFCRSKYLKMFGNGMIKHYSGKPINRIIRCNNNLGRLIGYFLSEGSVCKNTTTFSFNIIEKEYHTDVIMLVKEIFGINSAVHNFPDRHTTVIVCCSSIMAKFFKNLCLLTGEKRVLNKNYSIDFLHGILSGISRGDGNFNKKLYRCTIMLSVQNLIRDLFIISNICGIYPTLSKTGIRKDGRIYKSVIFNAENFNAISKIANLNFEKYASNLKKSDRLFNLNHILAKVSRINSVEYNGLVYNLQISGSNSFVVNNTSVHNCQYCGSKVNKAEITIDHIVPVSRGGQSTFQNCVVCCMKCNNTKADRTPSEVQMTLLYKPGQPSFADLYRNHLTDIPEEWKIYIMGLR